MSRTSLFLSALALLFSASLVAADNSCEYANDNECDESRYGGGGYCEEGTDTYDCAIMALGITDDSCEFARDNECDEPRFADASGACRDGTDTTDCGTVPPTELALQRLMDLVPGNIRAQLGDDSCDWARDMECDDILFGGTGACPAGTDASDCRALAIGGDESCDWPGDGECDEPGIGTGLCTSGTDTEDCATVAYLRNRDDSCNLAFDNQCNEPGQGDGQCAANSDTADCIGRGRPAEMENHFFGRDDRFLPDASESPWRSIGMLELPEGTCTGTLVAPNLVLTAAHCIENDDGTLATPLAFYAGQSQGRHLGEAGVISAFPAPDYDPETALPGGGNGDDWGIVKLDRPLGDQIGYLDIHVLTAEDLIRIEGRGLLVNQAGYSWDTGNNLSANEGCRVTEAFEDNSFLHECDTAKGDSGSPFLLMVDGRWQIIGVDSQFFDSESKNSTFTQGNLAVDSRAFATAVEAMR